MPNQQGLWNKHVGAIDGGSVSEELASQRRRPEFATQNPHKNLSLVAQLSDLHDGKMGGKN